MSQQQWEHEDIWRGLLYGQRSMLLRLTARLKRDFDLTAAQFEALGFLRQAPEHTLPATRLAHSMLYSSGAASHLFARLEQRGLLQRSPDPADARVVLVTLTPEGLRLAREAGAAHRLDLLEQFAPLLEGQDVQAIARFASTFEEAEGVRRPSRE